MQVSTRQDPFKVLPYTIPLWTRGSAQRTMLMGTLTPNRYIGGPRISAFSRVYASSRSDSMFRLVGCYFQCFISYARLLLNRFRRFALSVRAICSVPVSVHRSRLDPIFNFSNHKLVVMMSSLMSSLSSVGVFLFSV